MARLALIVGLTIGALAGQPAAAQTALRFDLVCEGAAKSEPTGPGKAESRRYSIDLEAKRWCRASEACRPREIKRVTPDDLVLDSPELTDDLKVDHTISRQAGTYDERVTMRSIGMSSWAHGECKAAPFSGFPKAKF